jgi:hypothetical protein
LGDADLLADVHDLAVQQAEGGAVVEWGDLVAGEYPA